MNGGSLSKRRLFEVVAATTGAVLATAASRPSSADELQGFGLAFRDVMDDFNSTYEGGNYAQFESYLLSNPKVVTDYSSADVYLDLLDKYRKRVPDLLWQGQAAQVWVLLPDANSLLDNKEAKLEDLMVRPHFLPSNQSLSAFTMCAALCNHGGPDGCDCGGEDCTGGR